MMGRPLTARNPPLLFFMNWCLVSSNHTEDWTITCVNRAFFLPTDDYKITSFHFWTSRNFRSSDWVWRFQQCLYLLMWTLSSVVETVHHKRAQCGEKQPDFPLFCTPLAAQAPIAYHLPQCLHPAAQQLQSQTHFLQMQAVTPWISLTWTPFFQEQS